MRKLFVLILLAGFSAGTLTSCGSKKEENKEEESGYETAQPETETAEPKAEESASSADLIKQGETLLNASDCKTCHAIENKIVGPAYKDVATKYEFTKANVAMLAGKVIKGGAGNWGDIPMTAHPDISQGDAEKMSMYVLSLDGEQPKD
jgi:cytochrome c